MATLEKIRSKSVLLVSVIFVALFLFIITIIDNPLGLFQDQTTVVNVNGEKISYETFQQRANEIRENSQQAENSEEQAMNSLVMESLLTNACKKIGLTVTDEELSNLIVGPNAPAQITMAFQQTFGAAPADVLQVLSNPAANNISEEQAAELSRHYATIEKNIADQLLASKYTNLLAGTLVANKLDSKAMFDEGNTTYTVASVGKNIFSVTDTITDAEILNYYNDHKAEYKLDVPTRYIKYVTLAIQPSPADRGKALQEAEKAIELVNASEAPGMEALAGNSAFMVESFTSDSTQLKQTRNSALIEMVKTAAPGEVRMVQNASSAATNPHILLARVISRENKVNTVKLSQVVIDPAFSADKVIATLNTGVTPDSIEGVMAGGVMTRDFKIADLQGVIDTLRSVGNGKYVALSQGGNTIAASILSDNAPEPVYEYVTATYNVEPSRETRDQLNSRMREFLIAANTADKFNNDVAAQQGMYIQEGLINDNSWGIANLEDSRNAAAWAMNAKKGEVSRLFTDSRDSRLMAVAVADIYKDYIPVDFPQLKSMVKQNATAEAHANKIIADNAGKGKSLADYQKLLGATQVDTIRNINLSSPQFTDLAGIVAYKPGQLVGPVRFNNNVIVYTITEATPGTMPFDEKSSATQFGRQAQQLVLGNNMQALLLGKGTVKSRLLKMTRQD